MKQQRRAACATLVTAIVCLAATVTQGADQATQKLAESLLKQHASALVMVEAEITINIEILEAPAAIKDAIEIPEQYESTEANGVVIDKSGLIVAPLIMLDPTLAIGEVTAETPMGPIKLSPRGSFSSVKVVQEDGTEQEAEIALIDRAAGVVLIKATSPPEKEMVALSTDKEDAIPDSFESLLALTRLSKDFGRKATCYTGRFIQQFPEPNAMLDVTGSLEAPGAAIFDSAGHFVGICTLPPAAEESQLSPVIMPSSRIARLAKKVLDENNNN